MIVGEVRQGVPVDEQRLLLVQECADEPPEGLQIEVLDGVHYDLVHPVTTDVTDERARGLRVEVPAGLPDHARVDTGVADVGERHAHLTPQGHYASTGRGDHEPETDMSCQRTKELEFTEKLFYPQVDFIVLHGGEPSLDGIDPARYVGHYLGFFNSRAGDKMVPWVVPDDHPRSLLTNVMLHLEVL